ncbi:hypothetical protein Tco_1057811 [Tanacetum coccineum]|uniref:Uncharacterized protein n=1 Tax=Tanacetum coccineum TaxID=301880 RepID=A0ABQ5H6N1_9ASTR
MALARSGACPRFFCLTGEYPCRIFNLCSVIDRGTPIMCFGSHCKDIEVSLQECAPPPYRIRQRPPDRYPLAASRGPIGRGPGVIAEILGLPIKCHCMAMGESDHHKIHPGCRGVLLIANHNWAPVFGSKCSYSMNLDAPPSSTAVDVVHPLCCIYLNGLTFIGSMALMPMNTRNSIPHALALPASGIGGGCWGTVVATATLALDCSPDCSCDLMFGVAFLLVPQAGLLLDIEGLVRFINSSPKGHALRVCIHKNLSECHPQLLRNDSASGGKFAEPVPAFHTNVELHMCPVFCVPRCRGVFWRDEPYSSAELAPTVLGVELGGLSTSRSALVQAAVDIAARWYSSLALFEEAGGECSRCRSSLGRVIVAVGWVVPRDGPVVGEDQIIWRIGASRGLLGDLSRGLVALLLRLRSPLGKVSLLCHSRFWQVVT